MSAAIAALAAIALVAIGVIRGTWAVGGSDSSCYGLMAKAFSEGHLQPVSALADAPWPNVPLTLVPGGFIPSALHAEEGIAVRDSAPSAPVDIAARIRARWTGST